MTIVELVVGGSDLRPIEENSTLCDTRNVSIWPGPLLKTREDGENRKKSRVKIKRKVKKG